MRARAELKEINVGEVSDVDRAANKKVFLVAKSDDEGEGRMPHGNDWPTDVSKSVMADRQTQKETEKAEEQIAKQADARKADAAFDVAMGVEKADESKAKMPDAKKSEDEACGDKMPGQTPEEMACGDKKKEEKASDAAPPPPAAAAQTEKAMSIHVQLLTEQRDAVIAAVSQLANVGDMSVEDAREKLSAVHSVLWAMDQTLSVVALAKADEPDPVMVAQSVLKAEIKNALVTVDVLKGGIDMKAAMAGAAATKPAEASTEKAADKPTDKPADATSATTEPAVAATEKAADPVEKMAVAIGALIEKQAAALAPLVEIAKALAAKPVEKAGEDVGAKVEAAVAKGIAGLSARLEKIEKSAPPPASAQPVGRVSAEKSDVSWPNDMSPSNGRN